MKTKSFFLVGLFLCVTMMLGFFVPQPMNAFAEELPEQLIEPISDGYFSLALQTDPRENQVVSHQIKEVTNTAGEKISYICLKWAEVEVLRFVMNLTAPEEKNLRFNYFSFSAVHVATDDIQTPLAPEPNKENVGKTSEINFFSNKTIKENSLQTYTFNYYVDSTYQIDKTDTTSPGKDFGIFKFQLSYNYSLTTEANIEGEETNKHIEYYIAILPTEITDDLAIEIKRKDIQILYRVTNERLMNKFVLWLTESDVLAYVNPKYIKWKVIGTDSKKNQYVLDDNQRGSGGERIVYDSSPVPPYGLNFEFDSNGIEGHWEISCEIQDQEGNVIFEKSVKNLSTYRVEKPSNLWWILLIIFGSLFIILLAIVLIYFIRKKHENVW